MKTNHLIALGAAAALAVAAAVTVSLTGSSKRTDAVSTATLFPALAGQINDVGKIVVQRKDETVTLAKTGDAWTVGEKYDYPAAFEKVRKVLVDLTELRPLEQKTSTPSLFPDLQLEDLTQPDAKSVLLTLKSAAGQDLLAVYVGKERLARGGTGNDATYIRQANQTQTWLAKGRLSLDKGPVSWLDRALTDVPKERIAKAVLIQPDGTKVTVSRAKATDKDFVLADVPKGKKTKSEWDINNVASPLDHLELDDVLPATAVPLPAKLGSAEFTTFDGLVLHVDLVPKDDQTWLRFAATYQAPTTAPSEDETKAGKLKSADDVKKEADALNAKTQAWAYKVPDWKLDNLRKKTADLVEDEKKGS